MPSILDSILRAGEGKILRQLKRISEQINSVEDDFVAMSDAELRGMTDEFKQRLADGETLDDILPEAFATVREAARRTLGQRAFDVQLMGGAALHLGNIAEMRTGEGKTLTGVFPAYLNALAGKGVHVVTTNDYLAKRDSEWMGRVHRFLGLEVGVILADMTPAERHKAYAADVTYGTNNEFGFDYLRDNMAWSLEECVQRGHNFAIVDEVDSILVDEARTPLIISGPAEQNSRWYTEFAKIAPRLRRGEDGEGDYEVDEKKRTVGILESGVEKVEDWLGIDNLYDPVNTPLVSFLNNALKAKELFKKDKDYVVMNGEVLIVDEFTGRILHGRRYNEGMHQAIEAKEGVQIKDENQTFATITLQNYFRLYDKLAGMTGTAMTEADEFMQIYKLGVVPIPTNKPMIRADETDVIYQTAQAKFDSVVEDIAERHAEGQPVLVGTVSVEKSEILSVMLKRRGIQHHVLNAKYHEQEAMIVAQSGRLGAVTVATNMAGRGTDIMLGGNPEFIADLELHQRGLSPVDTPEDYEAAWPEAVAKAKAAVAAEHEQVVEAGGLYVLGTERHESRRIDNQLRGRSGRQGDPGKSRFYLSLEDDLMRMFNSERVGGDHGPAEHPGRRPGGELGGLPRDQVRADPGGVAELRDPQGRAEVRRRAQPAAHGHLRRAAPGARGRGPARAGPVHDRRGDRLLRGRRDRRRVPGGVGPGEAVAGVQAALPDHADDRHGDRGGGRRQVGAERRPDHRDGAGERAGGLRPPRGRAHARQLMREIERRVVLSVLDRKWREHLYEMDYLREGIGLRAMAQRDPLVEYQREGYDMFNAMMDGIKEESVGNLFNLQFEIQENPIVEEVGAGAQLAFGGSLPGVTAGGAQRHPPRLPRRRATRARPAAGPPAPRRRRAAAFGKRPRRQAGRRLAAGPAAGTPPTGGVTPRRRAAARPRPAAAPPARPRPPRPRRRPTRSRRARPAGRSRCFPRGLAAAPPAQPPVLGAVRGRRRRAARRSRG